MVENVWINVAQELELLQASAEYDVKACFHNSWERDKWESRHWMNTPGTIYCAQTDNCATGMTEAPHNVRYYEGGHEVIYRQPLGQRELVEVVSAAACDPLSGYGCDGDKHWNRELLRAWWGNRERLKAEIALLKITDQSMEAHEYDDWLLYLDGDALLYLRVYAFFLENQRAPLEDETLPEL